MTQEGEDTQISFEYDTLCIISNVDKVDYILKEPLEKLFEYITYSEKHDDPEHFQQYVRKTMPRLVKNGNYKMIDDLNMDISQFCIYFEHEFLYTSYKFIFPKFLFRRQIPQHMLKNPETVFKILNDRIAKLRSYCKQCDRTWWLEPSGVGKFMYDSSPPEHVFGDHLCGELKNELSPTTLKQLSKAQYKHHQCLTNNCLRFQDGKLFLDMHLKLSFVERTNTNWRTHCVSNWNTFIESNSHVIAKISNVSLHAVTPIFYVAHPDNAEHKLCQIKIAKGFLELQIIDNVTGQPPTSLFVFSFSTLWINTVEPKHPGMRTPMLCEILSLNIF